MKYVFFKICNSMVVGWHSEALLAWFVTCYLRTQMARTCENDFLAKCKKLRKWLCLLFFSFEESELSKRNFQNNHVTPVVTYYQWQDFSDYFHESRDWPKIPTAELFYIALNPNNFAFEANFDSDWRSHNCVNYITKLYHIVL